MNDEWSSGAPAETFKVKRSRGIGLVVALAMSAVVSGVAGWTPPRMTLADPADDPCPLAMAIVCKFLPIAPGLDDDVDLTKPPPADPGTPDPQPPVDTAPAPMPQRTADICGNGCI